jgi:hypothetical protein
MSALGVSLSMRCRRGGQLAAVAEPPSGFGRILIIASAGAEPGAGAAIVTIPVGAVTVSAVTELAIGGTLAARLAVGAVTLVGGPPDDPQRPYSRRPAL